MDDNWDDFIDEDNIDTSVILRFEKALVTGEASFFDIDEFVSLIDHYLSNMEDELVHKAFTMAELQHPENKLLLLKKIHFLLETHEQEPSSFLPVLEKINPEDSDMIFIKAEIYLLMEEYTKALAEYIKLQEDPEDLEYVLMSIANVYSKMEQYDKAIEYRKKVIEQNPESPHPLLSLQYEYEVSRKIEEGVQYFQRLCEENPMGKFYWYVYANLLFNFELHEKAIEAVDYALAIDPNYTTALLSKAGFYSGMNEYEKSIEIYTDILHNHPNDLMLYLEIANCYENWENYEQALVYYKRVLSKSPHNIISWYGISICQYELGRLSEAYTSLKYLLHFDPENPDAWNLFGEYLFEMDKFTLALDAFEKAYQLDEENPSLLASLLIAYVKLQQSERAKEMLDKSKFSMAEVCTLKSILLFKQELFQEAEDNLGVSLLMDKGCIGIIENSCSEMLDSPQILKVIKEHIPNYKP